ncbi:hypothetical protein AB0M28_19585 [Streptomyces sp. NPDC051940]|uniref:hypothetical protein n=1 Tax=Streptomyces sp. NPDC051940 TaxID=3155675 RepID=UPI0034265E85
MSFRCPHPVRAPRAGARRPSAERLLAAVLAAFVVALALCSVWHSGHQEAGHGGAGVSVAAPGRAAPAAEPRAPEWLHTAPGCASGSVLRAVQTGRDTPGPAGVGTVLGTLAATAPACVLPVLRRRTGEGSVRSGRTVLTAVCRWRL